MGYEEDSFIKNGTVQVLLNISAERCKQDEKWGVQDHTEDKWFRILGEEFGEIGHALNELDAQTSTPNNMTEEELEDEIVQTAAVCVAWLEARWRRAK